MKKTLLLFAVSLIFSACNSKNDADYKAAAEDFIKKGNVSEAIAAYENLVEEFPESKLAPEAIFETATLYQNKMVKNLSEKESLEKSAHTFLSVYHKYPESKEAPMSLFMSGFIYANELKKFHEATEVYNLFLEKFPNHELVLSAKEELENMGLAPEEILKKKVSAGT